MPSPERLPLRDINAQALPQQPPARPLTSSGEWVQPAAPARRRAREQRMPQHENAFGVLEVEPLRCLP